MFFRQDDHETVRLQEAGNSGVNCHLQQYRDPSCALLRNKPDLQINFGTGMTAAIVVEGVRANVYVTVNCPLGCCIPAHLPALSGKFI
jgi:hypothetical protein